MKACKRAAHRDRDRDRDTEREWETVTHGGV